MTQAVQIRLNCLDGRGQMRTREMKLKHYGITFEENKWALEQARLKENEKLVRLAAEQSNPDIADGIIRSLMIGESFDKMNKDNDMNIKRDDFYAYRRQATYIFWILLNGRELDRENIDRSDNDYSF